MSPAICLLIYPAIWNGYNVGMTVKDLKERLAAFPDDAVVCVPHYEGGFRVAEDVEGRTVDGDQGGVEAVSDGIPAVVIA